METFSDPESPSADALVALLYSASISRERATCFLARFVELLLRLATIFQVPCIFMFPLSELLRVPGRCGWPVEVELLVMFDETFEKLLATLLVDTSSALASFT